MRNKAQKRAIEKEVEREFAHYESGKGSWVPAYYGENSPQKIEESRFLTVTVPEGSDAHYLLLESNYKFTTRKFGTITFSFER